MTTQEAYRGRPSRTFGRSAAQPPENTLISEIKRLKSLEEVVGSYVKLKPASGGKEMVGKCCFHEDSTPSLYVNSNEGTYCCRGCGASGNVVTFISAMSGSDYDTVKMDLARELGLLNEREVSGAQFVLNKMFERYANALASARNAREYLAQRGVSDEMVERFGLGYCWGNEFEKSSAEYIENAKKAGVYSERSGRSHLGGRLTFPIRSREGQVLGFAGRTIREAPVDPATGLPKKIPKYLNTHETEIFHRSEILYGMYEGKTGISTSGFAIIEEGFLDVITSHQFGVTNALAAMGADVTEKAFQKIWRHTDRLVFCLDGDDAGQSGTLRTVLRAGACMKDGQSIYVTTLPDNMDPDEYLRAHGGEAFRELVNPSAATPLSVYLLNQCAQKYDLASGAEQRSAFLMEMQEAREVFKEAPLFADDLMASAGAMCDVAIAEQAFRARQSRNAGLLPTVAEMEKALAYLKSRQEAGAPNVAASQSDNASAPALPPAQPPSLASTADSVQSAAPEFGAVASGSHQAAGKSRYRTLSALSGSQPKSSDTPAAQVGRTHRLILR